ncbi:MAG: YegP family protein [Faecousia sp.]
MGTFVMRTVPSGVKFDLYAANGQVVLSSEVYRTAAACRKGIESVRKNALRAGMEDQTTVTFRSLPNPKFEMYTDKSGAFRFRLKARNGQIIAVSEPYAAKAGCLGGIASVKENAGNAKVDEVLIRDIP